MTDERDAYTIFHFSQSNPEGPDQGNVAALLRRVADSIADLGDVEVQDITFGTELDKDAGSWPHLIVCYHRRDGDD